MGARTEGELDRQIVAVAVAARGDADGLPDTEGLPEIEREGGAVREGGREGAADGEKEPLRLTDGEPPALREREGCGVALPDGAPVREGDGDALEDRDTLALGVSPPRAGEGVPERLMAEPEGDVAAEREGVRDIEALPDSGPLGEGVRDVNALLVSGPLGEAPADCEGDPVAEREGGGVREALPLRSGDGVAPVGDAVAAAEGGVEVEPHSLADPPLLGDAGALSEAVADTLWGGDGETAPLALPAALPLAAEGVGVGAPGVEEGRDDGLCAPLALAPPAREGLAAAEGDAPPPSLGEGANGVLVGACVALTLREAATVGVAQLDCGAVRVLKMVVVAVVATLGVPRALAAADTLLAGDEVEVPNGVALGVPKSVAVPSEVIVATAVAETQSEKLPSGDAVAPPDAVLRREAVSGGLCEAAGEEVALLSVEADVVTDGEPLEEVVAQVLCEGGTEAVTRKVADGATEADDSVEAAAEVVGGAVAEGTGLPEEVADARGVAVKARDAVGIIVLSGDAEALAP